MGDLSQIETGTARANGSGSVSSPLGDETLRAIIADGISRLDVDGKRVVVVIPDGTRTAPLPRLFRALNEALGGRAHSVDYLIALGTHRAMEPAAIGRMIDIAVESVAAPGPSIRITNHAWADASQLVHIGDISPTEVEELSEGRLPTGRFSRSEQWQPSKMKRQVQEGASTDKPSAPAAADIRSSYVTTRARLAPSW